MSQRYSPQKAAADSTDPALAHEDGHGTLRQQRALAAEPSSPRDSSAAEQMYEKGAPATAPPTVTVNSGAGSAAGPTVPPEPIRVNHRCLLLEDSTLSCVPAHLRLLLQHYGQTTQAELLFLLVYAVALEAGYAAEEDYARHNAAAEGVPPIGVAPTGAFSAANLMRLAAHRPTYTHDDEKAWRFVMHLRNVVRVSAAERRAQLLHTMLTGFVSGEYMIVTLTPTREAKAAAAAALDPTSSAVAATSQLSFAPASLASRSLASGSLASASVSAFALGASAASALSGRSLCLAMNRYVLNSRSSRDRPIYQRFRKLNELSELLRAQVYVPMRNEQLALLEHVCVYPSLAGLPGELYDVIFQYLSPNQLKVLANVSRLLCACVTHSKHRRLVPP